MFTYILKIVQVEKTTPDVVTIFFKQPGLKKIKYLPGQYLTLIVGINGRKYIRPYSFSSAPEIDQHMAVTVKRIAGGVVSNYLYDHAEVDKAIEVMPPMGDFVYQAERFRANNIMLWGAGSGITPLMSILKTVLTRHPEKNVSLFYCNRNPEHTIFHDEIRDFENRFGGRLKVYNFYTRIPEDIYLQYFISGRIDEIKIKEILSSSDVSDSIHYICGPDGLKSTVKQALQDMNVPEKNIFSEAFEIFIDEQQFDDIETRTIKLVNNGQQIAIEVTRGKSILNAVLDAGVDISYSCQTGTCMLCKAKLLCGKLKLIGIDNLPDGLDNDDCLLCCSYPYTKNIEILTSN